MKLAVRGLFLLSVLGSTFAFAQNSHIQHIIVVVQENRTPDNLFQDPILKARGADIIPPSPGGSCHGVPVQLIGRPLNDCYDPNHGHVLGWLKTYDGQGNHFMDGACDVPLGGFTGSCKSGFPQNCTGTSYGQCPQYAFVLNNTAIQPYWQIAEKYGYANYFFQTNQGPSLPAHQFLLSGSSAPNENTPHYSWFDAENSFGAPPPKKNIYDSGCTADAGVYAALVDTVGGEGDCKNNPNDAHCPSPCYDRPTLTDLLDNHKNANGNPQPITWKYYGDQEASYWTAPNAVSHICLKGSDGHCDGPHWKTQNGTEPDVVIESTGHLAPFLEDLKACNLAQVTWVIPDGRWSDHPGSLGLGPDYVADIVNAVGGGMSGSTCNPPTNPIYWNNTVVLIVWDDWGGWYDHVNPIQTVGGGNFGYPNGNGNGVQYVYGFRVPFLVVSAYVKLTNGQPGYISGLQPTPIYYDFGSILKFIENAFVPNQEINTSYAFADHFAGIPGGPGDLTDFFDYNQAQRAFLPIALNNDSNLCNMIKCQSNQCDAACFIKYTGDPNAPEPDEGDQ